MSEEKVPKKFSDLDLGTNLFPEVPKKDLKDIMDKEIIIKEFAELPSDFGGTYLIVLAEFEGEDITFPIGSKVVVSQLKKVKEMNELPIETKVTEQKSKDGRMYQTLS